LINTQRSVLLDGNKIEWAKMRELTRSNDPVRLSWLRALLADIGVESYVFDSHTASVEGSINAISRRLMVADDDFTQACRALDDFGEEYQTVQIDP
jgi:hypothetical protein